jgi:hypothetical protein
MLKRLFVLALLLGATADLVACSGLGIEGCAGTPRNSIGPCSLGAHKDNS